MSDKRITVSISLTGTNKDGFFTKAEHVHKFMAIEGFDIFQACGAKGLFAWGDQARVNPGAGDDERRVDIVLCLTGENEEEDFFSSFTYTYRNVRESNFDLLQKVAMEAAFAAGQQCEAARAARPAAAAA